MTGQPRVLAATAVLGVMASVVMAGCDEPGAVPGAEGAAGRDSAGVRIVENGAAVGWPEGRPRAIRVDLEIGARRADPIAETGVMPAYVAMQRLGIGVDQQLVGIEAVAGGRIVGTVHPVAV